MTCNLCDSDACECGAEAEAGRRLLSVEVLAEAANESQWPELEAMERALADYGATREAA